MQPRTQDRSPRPGAGKPPREAWQEPGPYTGYGPRQEQHQPDERIREEVCRRLAYHGQVDARDIEVHVQNGEVTLRGLADDRQTKRTAERIAEGVAGVQDVHNQILLRNRELISEGQGMTTGYGRLRNGMHVAGSDGRTLGRIKRLRPAGFIVDRPFARDLYVPDEAIDTVSQMWLSLKVTARDAARQGWAEPESQETSQDQGGPT